MLNWNGNRAEYELSDRIAMRAMQEYPGIFDRQTVAMDVMACHLNGCPLDLVKLLEFDKFNFAHDIGGLNKHLDRTTGQLGDCFVPRCAIPVGQECVAY